MEADCIITYTITIILEYVKLQRVQIQKDFVDYLCVTYSLCASSDVMLSIIHYCIIPVPIIDTNRYSSPVKPLIPLTNNELVTSV